jgi:DEAD/DEAH box helicase domain-containing protein
MSFAQFFAENDWEVAGSAVIPARAARVIEVDGLKTTESTKRYLAKKFPHGIYSHQYDALTRILAGENLCVATGTASGKSLVFYASALDIVARKSHSRVLVMYPLRALGNEQEERWREAIAISGSKIEVGRIDGSVELSQRERILRSCNIVICTPDVIHAWLMGRLAESRVVEFLRYLGLIVIDEVHEYTGVFGSNGAFLFRRLLHALTLLGQKPILVAASATIANPEHHLQQLFGLSFGLIGPDEDGSPRNQANVSLVKPNPRKDLLTNTTELLRHAVRNTSHRFICFVDSRKQTEQIASILARSVEEDDDRSESVSYSDALSTRDHLTALDILPYRAGYEEVDRHIIQDRLSKGQLRGVISTSALELGIDIPYLDMGILVGVPYSSTSFQQRAGRIGRHKPGEIIVVHAGSALDETVFKSPRTVLERPVAEGALYLGNARIQYVHALCLSRPGGEHDSLCSYLGKDPDKHLECVPLWPEKFMDLCRSERIGELPPDLQAMKAAAGEDPNHAFPLRDVDSQFKVELRQGPNQQSLGELSYEQLMREAYPGGIYYYTTKAYRVYKILVPQRLVQVRREKRYTSKPTLLPVQIYPNFSPDNVFRAEKRDRLILVECNLQISESIAGFRERRGPNEQTVAYPLDSTSGVFYPRPRFSRNYFTSGVVITHPLLNSERVNLQSLSRLLYEAYVMKIPFERRDIWHGSGKHKKPRAMIPEGSRFIALYDSVYGSLRLTSRILDEGVLEGVLALAIDLSLLPGQLQLDQESKHVLSELLDSAKCAMNEYFLESDGQLVSQPNKVRVIKPGSRGLWVKGNNEEFKVERVGPHPSYPGLCYFGWVVGDKRRPSDIRIIPMQDLAEIPGESELATYNYLTGKLTRDARRRRTKEA